MNRSLNTSFLATAEPDLAFGPEVHVTPWRLFSIFPVSDVEDLEPIIAVLVVMAVIMVWTRAQQAEGQPREGPLAKGQEASSLGSAPGAAAAGAESQRQPAGRPRKSLTWLGALAFASAVMLGIQGALGIWSGSLTLLADMGHAAGDVVTYLAAYIVEKAKHDLTFRKAASGSAARLDAIGGTASTLLVMGVSVNAMLDAMHRLRSRAPDKEGEDITLIGPAILTFSVLSLAVNIGLLFFRVHKEEEHAQEGEQEPALPVTQQEPALPVSSLESTPPPPPPPLAHPMQRPRRQRGQKLGELPVQSPLAAPAGFSVEAPPPPPPPPPPGPLPDFTRTKRQAQGSTMKWLHAAFHPGCDGCEDEGCKDGPASDPSSEGASLPPPPPAFALMEGAPPARQTRRANNTKASSTKWLHAAFHPGCDGCEDEECKVGDAEVPPGGQPAGAAEAQEKNLNLYGATLHLVTDVVRSIIVLFTGLLLRLGVLTDVARTDAVCALVVGLCVLLGSAAFFYAPLVKMFSTTGAAAKA